MKKIFLIVVIIASIFIAMSAYKYLIRPSSGDAAPTFTLTSQDNNEISLKELTGKPVFVLFWASWCNICRDEWPSFTAFAGKYSKEGLTVLAISEDGKKGEMGMRSFLGNKPLPMTVLIDGDGRVADEYGIYALPEALLIGKDGVIMRRFSGQVEWTSDELKELITKALQ